MAQGSGYQSFVSFINDFFNENDIWWLVIESMTFSKQAKDFRQKELLFSQCILHILCPRFLKVSDLFQILRVLPCRLLFERWVHRLSRIFWENKTVTGGSYIWRIWWMFATQFTEYRHSDYARGTLSLSCWKKRFSLVKCGRFFFNSSSERPNRLMYWSPSNSNRLKCSSGVWLDKDK